MKQSKYWLRTKFPCIITFEAKDYKAHYIANDYDDVVKILYEIFTTNDTYGCYYEMDRDQQTWYDIIKSADFINEHFRELWDFIMVRSRYEYEKVEIIQPDKF